MVLRTDLDIILYKGLFACKDQYWEGIRACDNIVTSILDRFGNPRYELVISGKGNFRKQISSEYKANRKPESRPKYLYEAKEYFKRYWGAIETVGEEADDYIARSYREGDVIVTSDKDFRQLKAKIYNPWKDELVEITNPEYWFYYQMIVGDSADSIKTLPGYGPKKAEKILANKSPEEMKDAVIETYKDYYKDEWFEKYDTTARLLFLRRANCQEYYECY
jgi:5'-3' exonuclease